MKSDELKSFTLKRRPYEMGFVVSLLIFCQFVCYTHFNVSAL